VVRGPQLRDSAKFLIMLAVRPKPINCSNLSPCFPRRINLFLLFFTIWALLILLRLYQIMIVDRDDYLQQLEKDSWRTGTLPAIRGRILDQNGTPLAWSIRSFSLYYEPSRESRQSETDFLTVYKVLSLDPDSIPEVSGEQAVLIKDQLTPEDLLKLRPIMAENKAFRIESRFRRKYASNDSRLRRTLGSTTIIDNREVGVSGMEKEHNMRLTGIDGKYRVMLDKYNNWITETWVELQPPGPGYDVYIPYVTLRDSATPRPGIP
jgi:cell division protein FtsI/penicillin-binding protein 2